MTIKHLNKIITRDYNSIYADACNFINKSKHLDFDVIGYAYEEVLKRHNLIKSEEDVKRFFLRFISFASKMSNDKYRKLTKINPYEITIIDSKDRYTPNINIVDDYTRSCTTEDRMLIGLIESGHNTYSKLADVTLMPISTLHRKVKELKERVHNYKIKNYVKD